MDIDGIKISELTRIDSVTDNDDFVVNSGGVTHKTRFSVIKGIIVQYVNGAIDAINQALVGEVINRTQADNQLSGRIDTEVTARQSADSTLGGRIDAEVSARGLADVELGSRISAESTARQSADSTLGGRIDAEVSARQSADSALDSRISELNQSLESLENNTHKFTISTSDTTIVLPSTYRGVLITSDSDSTRCGIWMIFTYSDGTGSRTAMFSTSTGVVVTGTSNGLTVKTNSGGSYGLIIDISKHVTSIS